MFCPYCQSEQVFVTNSRSTRKNLQVWRRRHCTNCNGTFTTYEKINLNNLVVVKRSGKRQSYSRAKLYSGIYHSAIDTKGADRGVMGEFSEKITDQVEQQIILKHLKLISSTEIIDLVLKTLSQENWSIFLRYLAYREGNDKRRVKKLLREHLNFTG